MPIVFEYISQANQALHVNCMKLAFLFRTWPFLLTALGSIIIYANTWVPEEPNGGDNLWYIPTAMNLLCEGTLDLSSFAAELEEIPPWEGLWILDFDLDPRMVKHHGASYNLFPLGTSLVSLPLVWLHQKRYPPTEETNLVRYGNLMAGRFAAIFGGLSVGCMGLLFYTMGASRWHAFFMSMIYGFATPHFSTHAQGLWSHNPFSFFFLVALTLVLARKGKFAGWAGLPLATCYVIRPDASILIIAVTIYMLWRRPDKFIHYAICCAVVLASFIIHSLVIYQSLLPPYYLASRLSYSPRFWEAFAGHMASPNRGLLVFAPVFIFSFAGIYFTLQHRKEVHPLLVCLAPVPLLFWIIISFFPHWWGGSSYGPRLWSSALTVLIILQQPLLCMRSRSISVPPLQRRCLSLLFAVAVLWSAMIQYQGVTNQAVHDWNELPPNIDLHPQKIWDWSNLQFLARSTMNTNANELLAPNYGE